MDYTQLSIENLIDFIKNKISNFSTEKEKMQESLNYYEYKQDILSKQRLVISEDGRLKNLNNLPNNKLIDNKYAEIVDEKVDYLFSLPPTIAAKDKNYQTELQNLYNRRFTRTINKTALDAILYGIAWWHIYYDDEKGFNYELIDAKEVIPIWADNKHENLEALIRQYTVQKIENGKIKDITKVKLYLEKYVYTFIVENGINYKLESKNGYLKDDAGEIYCYGKIPFIYFKFNHEKPLLNRCKSLQDAINTILSNFQDNMLEDKRNSIFIIKNYDGTNLGEFRRNLSQYGAVKVRTNDGTSGGVETLEVNVNYENYQFILQILKEKLIDNAKGIDLKNERTTQAPNELNIKSMYTKMELDANAMELEFTASLEHLEEFYKKVKNINVDEVAKINFKRNITVNEESVVNIIKESIGVVSDETLLSHHPFVENVEDELKKISKQKDNEINQEFIINGADNE